MARHRRAHVYYTVALALSLSRYPYQCQQCRYVSVDIDMDMLYSGGEGCGSGWTRLAILGSFQVLAEAVRALAAASVSGVDVHNLLTRSAAPVKSETQLLSGKSVASGLRCWHELAVGVLGYEPERSIPPRESLHVERFVSIFKNGATAELCRIRQVGLCAQRSVH